MHDGSANSHQSHQQRNLTMNCDTAPCRPSNRKAGQERPCRNVGTRTAATVATAGRTAGASRCLTERPTFIPAQLVHPTAGTGQ